MFQKITFGHIALAVGGILILLFCEKYWFPTYFPTLTIVFMLAMLVILALLIYRKLIINFQDTRKVVSAGIRQMNPLLFLHQEITFRRALPPLRGYAASPDLLALIVQLVQAHQPQTIVEAGSGVSTLINAYLLEKQGHGKVYSLDDEAVFGQKTQDTLEDHQLTSFGEVLHAPLTAHAFGGQTWRWYATQDLLRKVKKIDFLIVDGPPSTIQQNARYPALPILLPYLSEQAVILVDDCNRKEDRATVERWLSEYPEFQGRFYALEKGAYVLKRRGN